MGSSKSLAETVLKKRKVEIAEGKFLDIRKEQKIKFEQFCEEFIANYLKPNIHSWEKSTIPSIVCLKRFFAGRYLNEITPLLIEKFKNYRLEEDEVKPATVNRALACL